MAEELTLEKVKHFIDLELDEFYIKEFREKHHIDPESSVLYASFSRLVDNKYIKKVGRGCYRRVKYASPIKVFGRERRPPITLNFPRDFDTGKPLFFAKEIVIREGDLILISGFTNKGKTLLCINFAGENIQTHPVLLGNEYTTVDGEPSPRFLNRLDEMKWVEWADQDGNDNFELLPVMQDYAEHVRRDRNNIIDWINLPGEYYMISPVLEGIKRAIGKGVGIVSLQKNPGTEYGRGGNPSKDFADLELLLDKYGENDNDVMLTIGKVKEPVKGCSVSGRKFVYRIKDGVKITNFREVIKCPQCYGKGWLTKGNVSRPCDACNKLGYIDKEEWNHDV